ncbi:MAG: HrpB1 family type III secretion system apparatus protein [Methylacidiphilaceae bacterium]|nr:HrpB1 family type III secretion system apparatus protein [Candidatus Methylacidiphilaceae bacterium]
MKNSCGGLEIEQRLKEDADRSYERALLALLDEERQRVARCLAAGAPIEEYQRLQSLAEGLLAAVAHLQALAAQRGKGSELPAPVAAGKRLREDAAGALYKLLIELGFSAAFRGLTERAARIFTAGRVLRPTQAHALLGEAVIRLQKLELSEATNLLEEAIRREPDNKLVQAFGDLCFQLLRQLSEGRGALESVIGNGATSVAGRLVHPR